MAKRKRKNLAAVALTAARWGQAEIVNPAKAAQALNRHRWGNVTPEERSQVARRLNAIGWSGEQGALRRKRAATRGSQGGRPRLPDRCPCGRMTRERARQRNHRCEAP